MDSSENAPRDEDQSSEEFDFGMTDLEERLKGPGGMALRDEILERLTTLGNETKTSLDGGLPPEEYAAAEATYGALAAAYDIVVNFPVAQPEDS